MLYTAMKHPAMLVYLDNQLNSKDNPNENLGRELLELHTVGVGNYDETDVRQSALILTGHSYNWEKRAYHYEPGKHYTGPVKVRGSPIPTPPLPTAPPCCRPTCPTWRTTRAPHTTSPTGWPSATCRTTRRRHSSTGSPRCTSTTARTWRL